MNILISERLELSSAMHWHRICLAQFWYTRSVPGDFWYEIPNLLDLITCAQHEIFTHHLVHQNIIQNYSSISCVDFASPLFNGTFDIFYSLSREREREVVYIDVDSVRPPRWAVVVLTEYEDVCDILWNFLCF